MTTRNGAGAMLSQFGHETDATLMLKYDAEGSLTKLRALLTNAASLSGTTDYSYNGKQELTGESSTRSGTYTNSFGYDATGNPTAWNANSQNLIRTFNANNQETTGGTTNYNYDGEGNPTIYKGAGLSFDVNNHLTSYGTLLTACYRSDGKRAWKANSAGTRTYFLYDGDAVISELDSNGNTTYTNTWGANGLVSRRDEGASSTRFYTWDQQGNVAQALDASGNVLDSHSFTAFGQRTAGTASDPYSGYNGQWGYYTDAETGWILCTYRYYDPSNGRWLTRDPICYNGGLNLYGYATNNPTNLIDPDGLRGIRFGNVKLFDDGKPWLAFGKESSQAARTGFYSGLDGLNPLGDPFKNRGYYDPCDSSAKMGYNIGKGGQLAIGVLTVARVAPFLTRAGGGAPRTMRWVTKLGGPQKLLAIVGSGGVSNTLEGIRNSKGDRTAMTKDFITGAAGAYLSAGTGGGLLTAPVAGWLGGEVGGPLYDYVTDWSGP